VLSSLSQETKHNELIIAFELVISKLPNVKIVDGERVITIRR